MSGEKISSADILGIKPVGETVLKIASVVMDGAVGFLHRICSPAAEEFGLLLQDRVKAWRAANAAKLLLCAEKKIEENGDGTEARANPRLVFNILEQGSWIEDSVVQEMWSGLLASACTADGDDDSNLLFTNILANLTKLQALIVKNACERAAKHITYSGLIEAGPLHLTRHELHELTGEQDVHRLDRELDSLRALDLIKGGFHSIDQIVDLTPSPLALNMYVRCHGSRKTPIDFFGLSTE